MASTIASLGQLETLETPAPGMPTFCKWGALNMHDAPASKSHAAGTSASKSPYLFKKCVLKDAPSQPTLTCLNILKDSPWHSAPSHATPIRGSGALNRGVVEVDPMLQDHWETEFMLRSALDSVSTGINRSDPLTRAQQPVTESDIYAGQALGVGARIPVGASLDQLTAMPPYCSNEDLHAKLEHPTLLTCKAAAVDECRRDKTAALEAVSCDSTADICSTPSTADSLSVRSPSQPRSDPLGSRLPSELASNTASAPSTATAANSTLESAAAEQAATTF